MFLDSTYQPNDKQSSTNLNIYDVAVLTAQIGDKPVLSHGNKHLTAGMVQLVCYIAQGEHMAKTGRSLFGDDFYIVDTRIENPKITKLFGDWNKRVTPFTMKEEIKVLLSPINSGFTIETNKLCQEVAFSLIPRDYKTVLSMLKETKPYKEALKDPFKKIDKKHIKEYFESQIIKPTEIIDITIGV